MDGIPEHPEALLQQRAWLVALARQLVLRDQEADELAQEALAAAVLQAAPHSVGPRSWLAAILRKQIAGRRREARRRQQREAAAARRDEVPPVLDTVLRFEVQRDVASAVLALAEPYRSTVLLRFWDGLSPGAIARREQVPVETVRTRLKRGLALLRERLDRSHGDDRRAWAVPLLVAVRPVHSTAAMVGAGVLLMTTMQKLVTFAAVAALLALVPFAFGWSPLAEPPAAATQRTAATAAAGVPAAIPSPVEDAAGEPAASRALAAAVETEPQVVVIGRVVDDETGNPIAGAAVRLVAAYAPSGSGDVAATTGGDGAFELRDPRANDDEQGRAVVVRARDFATLRKQVPQPATPPPAGVVASIDLGDLRAVRGTRFAGRVVDQRGHGVADAELRLPLFGVSFSAYGERTEVVGRTDHAGAFRLDDAVGPTTPSRTFLFAVAATGLGWCAIEPIAHRHVVDDLTIQLCPAGGVAVNVVDAAGRPVAGAVVRALPRFVPIGIPGDALVTLTRVAHDDSITARFCGRTDERGECRFDGLPIGPVLTRRGPDSREREMYPSGRLYSFWAEAEGLGRQPIENIGLRAGEVQPLLLRVVAVRSVTVPVVVRDDLGAPIAGATVCGSGDDQLTASTDAAGRVELRVTATTEVSLSVRAGGHRSSHRTLSLVDGVPSAPVEFVLARTTRITGRVVDQFGVPLADARLFVDDESIATTDAAGNFAADEFPNGPHQLVVALPSASMQHWTGEQSPEVVDAQNGPVTIVMQRRPGNALVRIAVVDAANGEPLDLVETRLGLWEQDGYFLVKGTQQERGLVTSTDTPAGRWRLDVRTATGHRGSLRFEIAVDQPPQDLRLQLQQPGTVIGELRFLDVPAPAEVTLRVDHATPDPKSFTQFRYPGTWRPDPANQVVAADPWGGTGALRVHPAQNVTFRLDSADPTDDLVFTVHGDGIEGRATVRVQPGQTAQVVVEVHGKR